MSRIDTFLDLAVKQGASDLLLVSGNPPRIRLFGDVVTIRYRELTADETQAFLFEILPDSLRVSFEKNHGVDFAYEIPGLSRFRVNLFRHLGGVGAAFRVVPAKVPAYDSLGLPPTLRSFCQHKKGMVLITGATGTGKSTTLAALVDHINESRKGHIITIEDPIEFIHARKNCLVSQREVGTHTPSFAAALRSALREDPDVLLVGELRDYDSVSLAVTAAETGVLVMGTLHTGSAAATVDRIINVFPAPEQPQIRMMLSTSLVGIASQLLIRKAEGRGVVPAIEVLVNNAAVSNLIREGKTDQLTNVMQGGALQGMQTMDNALRKLLDERLISGEEAYRKATVKADFEGLRETDKNV